MKINFKKVALDIMSNATTQKEKVPEMEFEVAEYSGGGMEVTRITRFGADEASAWKYANALAGKGVYAEVHAEQRKDG